MNCGGLWWTEEICSGLKRFVVNCRGLCWIVEDCGAL